MVIAGGSVAACLKANGPDRSSFHSEESERAVLSGSDLDVFFFGITAEQANKKLLQLHEHLRTGALRLLSGL